MPQLDPSSFSSQLFWLTVSFVILYVVLARFFLPRMQAVFDLRSRTMGNDLEHAETLQSEAKRAQDAYEKTLADARAKSQDVVSRAKQKITDDAASWHADLDSALEKQLADSDAAITRAKKDVMAKLRPVTREVAEKIVEVILNYKPDSQEIESALGGIAKESAA